MDLVEDLLDAWVNLSLVLRNDRFMSDMTFNEAIVCRIIKKEMDINKEYPYIQFKTLCKKSNMVKSAVTRVLNDLENKNIIEKFKLDIDKKNVFVRIKTESMHIFTTEHNKLLATAEAIKNNLGEKDTQLVINTLNKLNKATTKLIETK